MNRFKNGFEDSIYPYGYELTKKYVEEHFDQSFWNLNAIRKRPGNLGGEYGNKNIINSAYKTYGLQM